MGTKFLQQSCLYITYEATYTLKCFLFCNYVRSITQKVSILGYMLLHKLYINMVLARILQSFMKDQGVI